jgi:hypothetical protein
MPEGCPTICDPSFTGIVTEVESVVWDGTNLIQTSTLLTFKKGKLITQGDPVEEIIFSLSDIDQATNPAQTIFLDKNAAQMSANGLAAYSTFQAAYDAANAAQVALGGSNRVVIVVGIGTDTEFGGLVLTADYNINVLIVGRGATDTIVGGSVLGAITGGFNVEIELYNVRIGGITQAGKNVTVHGRNVMLSSVLTTNTAGKGGDVVLNEGVIRVSSINTDGVYFVAGDRAGDVTVGNNTIVSSISAKCTASAGTFGRGGVVRVGNNCRVTFGTTSTGLAGGSITIGDNCRVGALSTIANNGPTTSGFITVGDNCELISSVATDCFDDPSAVGSTAGAITIGKGCTVASTITAHGLQANMTGGAITIGEGTSCGPVTAQGTTIGGAVTLKSGVTVTSITWLSNPGVLTAHNARISGQIDILNALSVCRNVIFSTSSGNLDCIADVSGNGPQLTDCLFIANGTGASINATSARSVTSYNGLMRTAAGANITLLGANNYVDSTLTFN